MTPTTAQANPFLLMVQPEVVLAAMEKSEKLGRLNRHLCRPLDRPLMQPAAGKNRQLEQDDQDGAGDDEL